MPDKHQRTGFPCPGGTPRSAVTARPGSANFKRRVIALWLLALAALPRMAAADNLYVVVNGGNKIGKYTTAGAVVNASLITGLNNPSDLALDGQGNLFVANLGSAKVSEFTTSGATVNANLITGLTVLASNPRGLAMEGGTNLFIAHLNGHAIGRYTITNGAVGVSNSAFISGLGFPFALAVSAGNLYMANSVSYDYKISKFTTAGATVNSALVTGVNNPLGVAVDGTNLFVSCYNDNKVAKYTTAGAVLNANFITGLSGPYGLAADGKGSLYVVNYTTGTIGKYDATSGAAINATLISGLNGPLNLQVEATPPVLSIRNQANNVVVFWPSDGTFLLQTNSDLTTANWGVYSAVTTTNGTNSAILAAPANHLFFRLAGSR
jgi:DNA-binding beta-propeller fold protein YncE